MRDEDVDAQAVATLSEIALRLGEAHLQMVTTANGWRRITPTERSGAPRSCDALGQPGMPSMAEMPAFRFGGVFELPPGATFEPDPGTSMECGHKVTKA